MVKITNNNIGDFFMKKWIWLLALVVVFFVFASEEKELRFRVIANSDSVYDQDIKMEVVQALQETLATTHDLSIIQDKCEYIISKYSVNYGVRVSLKKHRFAAKTLNGEVIPGGVYETIVVSLGEAKGKNYWTVLYPSFFDVSFEEVTDTDIEYKSWFVDKILGE